MPKLQISPQTQEEALKIAKATQRPGQTKEQTKLIAQGIEKGIAEYKKREKAKSRERDKLRKKELQRKVEAEIEPAVDNQKARGFSQHLPWLLLLVSWCVFGLALLSIFLY